MPSLIPVDRQPRMPWRNGRGETREVAAWPAGSTLDTFEWRVSVATISEDGAFSRFPGVVRTISLLSGAGIRLDGEATRIELAQRHAVATYRGDEEVHCRVLGGVVQVLNVMVRGDGCAHVGAIGASPRAAAAPARFRVCIASEGVVECALAAKAFTLMPGDALVVDDAVESRMPLDVRAEARAAALIASIELGQAT